MRGHLNLFDKLTCIFNILEIFRWIIIVIKIDFKYHVSQIVLLEIAVLDGQAHASKGNTWCPPIGEGLWHPWMA